MEDKNKAKGKNKNKKKEQSKVSSIDLLDRRTIYLDGEINEIR